MSPAQAKTVLDLTGAAGVMIGRAAQGRPWIFREINHFLEHGEVMENPSVEEMSSTVLNHLTEIHQFYGEYLGVRIARKHIGWYINHLPGGLEFRKHFNTLCTEKDQYASVQGYFEQVSNGEVMAA
jgi:tRNA-dihydrouridine synthase B